MGQYIISKLLNDTTVSKFLTKKLNGVNDLSGGQYSVNKDINFKTPMLRPELCDYNDAYIAVKGAINILAAIANENYKAQRDIAFKNNAPFRSCISEVNNTLIDNAEDLDIIMLCIIW